MIFSVESSSKPEVWRDDCPRPFRRLADAKKSRLGGHLPRGDWSLEDDPITGVRVNRIECGVKQTVFSATV